MELYLRLGGRFGFVMPAATLPRLQYRGFRAADYSSRAATAFAAFDAPWELSEVRPQPFPVPACIVFGRRVDADELAAMPENATWWQARVPDQHRAWDEVEAMFAFVEREVVVAGSDFDSPYAELVRQGSNLVPRVLLAVRQRDAGPLALPTGQIAVESGRLGGEKPPWRDLPTQIGEVEEQFVMPMLLGNSLLPFGLRGDTRAVIPWDGAKLLTGADEAIEAFPGLAAWWRNAERLFLRHRSETTTLDLNGQIDYQGKLRAQFPLGAHRVAYTGRGEIVTAARISDPHAVVDHALYWAEFEDPNEALYVVGVINTKALHTRIVAALSKGLFGGRNIHRAPFLLVWPQYDPKDDTHRHIAAAAEEAERVGAHARQDARSVAAARARVRAALEADGIAARLEALVEQLLSRAGVDEQLEEEAVRAG